MGAKGGIAIIGMACVYPDARTPAELWENVLAQRRAFRRLPPERLRVEDYWSADPQAPDRTYATEAAVIEGYEFDRVAFRVVGSTFRSADLTHWLALDVASKALADAGFADGRGLPRESTGVLLGNTLTGEFSRANILRLRWPYVRRVVEAALASEGWTVEKRQAWLGHLEAQYKAPFPPVGEETLAGGLSNTIAGRICNQFDLNGGGYTVDGACSSSLLAVANACSALVSGDLDVALAGGVDLSLDPFELVGFAKVGALAADEMRVFDRRSAGFLPGEGCGFVALMRHEDALAQGSRIYAVIRGWGISSDGSGGLTRPETDGQLAALNRAYHRAGFGADTVAFCEGHGTGTTVGDATELEVLARARREARAGTPAAAVGSIKANIGHTKAAAGVAGLIKATLAVHTQVLPPATGCEQPHPQLLAPGSPLRIVREAELWPATSPLRASVSAMGFGGINVHVVLENPVAERRRALSSREHALSRSSQDSELFLLAAPTQAQLLESVLKLLEFAGRLSRAELTDLAANLAKTLEPGPTRAAIVASRPAELAERLKMLASWLQGGMCPRLKMSSGLALGTGDAPPHIALLFPGQGSPMHSDGGIWRWRFDCVRDVYEQAALPEARDSVSTRVMQPAIVAASLAGLRVLHQFGLVAEAAIGHSLGELVAAHWAEALSEEGLLRIARVRGAAMAELGASTGAMLAIAAPAGQVQTLLRGNSVSIVGFNSPRQTVVAGEAGAVKEVNQRASAAGWRTTPLPVSHAFHTPLVAAATPVLAEQLACEDFAPLRRRLFSTVTGGLLSSHHDLRELFCRQVTSPVRFEAALTALLRPESTGCGSESGQRLALSPPELLIEVGPGSVLSGLVRDTTDVPVVSLDAGGPSLRGLLEALGAAFALGAPLQSAALFADRFTRPFALDWKPKFFANPCERAPMTADSAATHNTGQTNPLGPTESPSDGEERPNAPALEPLTPVSTLELIRGLVAERAELPLAAVGDEHRMLNDLHLNSISVGQLVAQASRQLGLPRLAGPTEFANASVMEIAGAFDELKRSGATVQTQSDKRQPPGVDIWIETFAPELVEASPPQARRWQAPASAPGSWQVFAPENHPLAAELRLRLAGLGQEGVILCVPKNPAEDSIQLFLASARAALALSQAPRFVVVQHGWGAAGLARTLHLEAPGVVTCVVNVPPDHPRAVEWIINEALAATGYSEAHYDAKGRRRVPRLKWLPLEAAGRRRKALPIGPEDVVLVTGGGKGIGAECALALGRATGAKVALLGRAEPVKGSELAANLARMAAAGIRCRYLRADVTDPEGLRTTLGEAEQEMGPITALVHCAGTNTPQLIANLEESAFRRTLAPKLQGVRNVLAALNPDQLRVFVTFGSIIGRAGLRGEADYATANEWLTAFTEQFQAEHPKCRCLAFEWSVWSGVGMGERLGRVESLIQEGIMPIPPDEGVRILLGWLQRPPPSVALVVTGRFGSPPTVRLTEPELPLQRFLEKPRVYYPGVELVVDADLSAQSDLYLKDHALQKQMLFPAVLGLEAMAQAAMALTDSKTPPVFEEVELSRPVVVSDSAPTTIRLAALRRGANLVEVCLRSAETDYHVDHFRALCRFGGGDEENGALGAFPVGEAAPPLLDPKEHLYGPRLFHEGRFRRLRGYQWLTAKECVGEITADGGAQWFGPYLPSAFVLGDPAARDAAMHAIQACIPHQRILPTGIERLVIRRTEAGTRFVRARERSREGNSFIYDLEVTDAEGEVVEHWQGLRLCAVDSLATPDAWALALLAPYLERRVEELVGGTAVRVVFERDRRGLGDGNSPKQRRAATDRALRQALGAPEKVLRRPDGKPTVPSGKGISAAHAQGLTLAVAGSGLLACDLETVAHRPDAVWRDLLGDDWKKLTVRISQEAGEDPNMTDTRLWSVLECLKKAGLPPEGPLTLESTTPDKWVLLRSGAALVATYAGGIEGVKSPLVIAIALSTRPAKQRAFAPAEALNCERR